MRYLSILCVFALAVGCISAQATQSAWDVLTNSDIDYSGFVTGATISGASGLLANDNAKITLFAPTNNAFGELVEVTGSLLTNLFNMRFRRHLICFINSHIVDGVVLSTDINGPTELTSLSGYVIQADNVGVLTADGTRVAPDDIEVTNGVVQVLDDIPILPPCIGKSIGEQAADSPEFSTLVEMATNVQFLDYLNLESPITVLAPTNAAWDKLSVRTKNYLNVNPFVLQDVLRFHVIPSVQFLDQAPAVRNIRSVQGEGLMILNPQNGELGIMSENDIITSPTVRISSIDNLAQNGIFHIIDDVLFPPSFALPALIICFPGDATVHVKGSGTTLMKHVKIGDEVMTFSGGTYSKVYSFGHYQPKAIGEYLQLFTKETAEPLQISKDHMVFVDSDKSVPAASLQVGDQILLAAGTSASISKISTSYSTGAYAPFTESGSIVVNGVVASSYITMDGMHAMLTLGDIELPISYQWVSHASQAPHRLYCRLFECDKETYSVNGVSQWVDIPYRLCRFVLRQSTLIQLLAFLMLVPVFAVSTALEVVVNSPTKSLTTVVGVYFLSHYMCKLRLQSRK